MSQLGSGTTGDDSSSVGFSTSQVERYFHDDEQKDYEVMDATDSLPAGPAKKVLSLASVDHSKIVYAPFLKKFYTPVSEIANLTVEEVAELRRNLDNLKVVGKDCPNPIKDFHQSGASDRILRVLEKLNFKKPTPIQAQAIPVMMSGRDIISIAKTGSGKT